MDTRLSLLNLPKLAELGRALLATDGFADDYVAYLQRIYVWGLPVHAFGLLMAARPWWGSQPSFAAIFAGQAVLSLAMCAAVAARPVHTLRVMRVGLLVHVMGFVARMPQVVLNSEHGTNGLIASLAPITAGLLALHTVFPTQMARRVCFGSWAACSAVVMGTVAAISLTDGVQLVLMGSALRFVLAAGATVALASVVSYLHDGSLRLTQERSRFEQLALSDPLTGLPNRRAFDITFEREVARARRYREPLSVAVVDVDHFKRVNDTHGHDVGDEILAAVARVIRDRVRASDAVARWGGEEFAIILPGADEQGGHVVAEHIRAAVEAYDFGIGPVTVSVGITQLRGAHDSVTDMLKSADEALYDAKEGGRNRVASASDPVLPLRPVVA